MATDWIPKDNEVKNHQVFDETYFGTIPPCVTYELKPVLDPKGNPIKTVNSAWITLNNPDQYNSYTTEMVKGVIAGMHKASMDRTVSVVVFTGAGDKAFCTGGNTKEYAEYYSKRPFEYAAYVDLFNAMVDAILLCKKPVICRVNGMRIAGGQEIGMATDITISSDLAVFGQAGPRHGSSPDGGSTDFLPWFLSMEDALWNCVSCESWSAYKMKFKGLITQVVPVLKRDKEFIPNPLVITDRFLNEKGQIVYGEFKSGEEAEKGKALLRVLPTDFTLLEDAVNKVIWTLTNLMPMCLARSIDGIRMKKKYFWDQTKLFARYWLGANMNVEAFIGFNAFNTKKMTGKDTIDFIKYRQLLAEGQPFDDELVEEVMAKPTK